MMHKYLVTVFLFKTTAMIVNYITITNHGSLITNKEKFKQIKKWT